MKFAVISSSPLVATPTAYSAYSPYVKELQVWAQYVDEVSFMCPVWQNDKGLLISEIGFPITQVHAAREFNIKSVKGLFNALRYSFRNFYQIYQIMKWADHIHLRCPGNIGLMGCLVQILFPRKQKTAKYAGNWDPKSNQPRSYKIQQWLLSNTFLTRNMQVLVYGQWPGSTRNIKPFFTASYTKSDIEPITPRVLNHPINIVYVGTLAPGKRAMYAVKLVQELQKAGLQVSLSLYGHGPEKQLLTDYIHEHSLDKVQLMGNHPQQTIKKAFQQSHFVILPSKSEGWPKVVAEAMFWGCVPLVTRVSCLPYMLDEGNRGVFLDLDLGNDSDKIRSLLNDPLRYKAMSEESISWSRQFTLDLFASEIKALVSG